MPSEEVLGGVGLMFQVRSGGVYGTIYSNRGYLSGVRSCAVQGGGLSRFISGGSCTVAGDLSYSS